MTTADLRLLQARVLSSQLTSHKHPDPQVEDGEDEAKGVPLALGHIPGAVVGWRGADTCGKVNEAARPAASWVLGPPREHIQELAGAARPGGYHLPYFMPKGIPRHLECRAAFLRSQRCCRSQCCTVYSVPRQSTVARMLCRVKSAAAQNALADYSAAASAASPIADSP